MTVRANKPAFNIREKLTELKDGKKTWERAFVLLGVSSGRSAASVTAGNTYTISYDDVLQGDASLWNSTDPGGYAYYFKCPRNGHYHVSATWQLNQVPVNGTWAWNASIFVGTETSFGSGYWGTYQGHSNSGNNSGYDKADVNGTIYCTAGQCIRLRMTVNASFAVEYSSADIRHRCSIVEL